MLINVSRRGFLTGLLASSAVALIPVQALAGAGGLATQAIQYAVQGDFQTGGELAQRSGDQAAVKLVELLFLRDHGHETGIGRIIAFLNAAPNWPLTDTLLKRAEQALYETPQDTQTALSHFKTREPQTPTGMLALARAHYTAGDAAVGKQYLARAWNNSNVDAELEKKVLAEFGPQLTSADHRSRLWRLIYAQESSAAIRNAKRLGGDYVNAALVAQMLHRGIGGADHQYAGLPPNIRNELSLRYALARFYRRAEKFDKARAIISAVKGPVADPFAWWEERRIIARRSVGPNNVDHFNAAYQIAKNHGLPSSEQAMEAEFIAGWVALRFLRKPDVALNHFSRYDNIAITRTDKAKAEYWIGRAAGAIGDKASQHSAFQASAQHSTVYYGQLAREQLGFGATAERINSGQPSAAAMAKVERDEVVRAMRLMAQVAPKEKLNIFLWSLANRFNTVDELNAAATVVQNVAGTSWSLRLAKAASQRGLDIDSWSYPVMALPRWAQIGKPIERSLVFALSRQESEFDPNAGSSVGAQGLMQLMPGTARLVARQYRVPFVQAKLRGDPAYNVKLGAAHLADLVDSFSGSYVLTLVAYNAGPRRAREWVEQYGDPRGGQVDPIDWVECIPFDETRQYVQKVMQNVHVYRSRLAPDTVRPMTADLKRGTPSDINVASTTPVENPQRCKGNSLMDMLSSCK
jgi:soluble lytic murein transglycosylase